MQRDAKPIKAHAKATVIEAASPHQSDGGGSVRALEQRLAEAVAQQSAISEILRVISASPSDVQPVLQAVAEHTARLCRSPYARVLVIDGDLLQCKADYAADGGVPLPVVPTVLRRTSISGRAVIDGETVHHADILPLLDGEYPDARRNTELTGFRAVLAVPLMGDSGAYGAIFLWRREPGLFAPDQVEVVQTFARQVSLAVDNVRRFKETKEALEQQTATGEILRAISRSPTEIQPVLEAVVHAAARFCAASDVMILRVEGDILRGAAGIGPFSESVSAHTGSVNALTIPLNRGSVSGRVVIDGRTVHIPDLAAESEDEFPQGREMQRQYGHHTILAAPLMRDGAPIGVIALFRYEANPFSDKQVELLENFAAQAVIAIENVRMFTELGMRNRDLMEALEQQTATSEILRVISRSQTDVQPVFECIAESALKLCRGGAANVVIRDGDVLRMPAYANATDEGGLALRSLFPRPFTSDTGSGRAIASGRMVTIDDVLTDPGYGIGASAVASGFRSILAVPLIRDGAPIGAISVGRVAPGPFSDKQILLLQTFADQAVIAIENVRLFTELAARTDELTQSVNELKALGEVGQAISSTLDLETVLQTIVSRATQISGMDGGAIFQYDEAREEFFLHATDKLPEELVEALRNTPTRKGEGAVGRLAVTGEPVAIQDIADTGSYQSRVREILLRLGFRSLLAVPLLRDDRVLGGLAVNRKSVGAFSPQVVALLKTFAAQSALAIQNARLFREIEAKSRQLETASRHKSEFLANMSHELRTPLNAIIGFSEVLAERMFGEINDKQAEYLGDILESGRHLLSLINDILDLSKIEAGRMELDPSEFNLPQAIDNTLTLVRERIHRRGIALECCVAKDVGTIHADERKVKQVLLNLLSNAIKFTPEGGRIGVRAESRDGMVEVAVTDTGVGIASGDLAAVFEEFRQVGAADRKVEGTGLGLAISRKFIELHGGSIGVTSEVNHGSTFVFTLPLAGRVA